LFIREARINDYRQYQLIKSPMALGEEFGEFFDYAICKLKNEFALRLKKG